MNTQNNTQKETQNSISMNTQVRFNSQINPWGNQTSREDINAIILNHNKVIDTIYALNFNLDKSQFLKGMSLWDSLAIEGSYIVSVARSNGINVKVSMTDGKISYYDFYCFYEVYFKNGTKMLIHSGNDKLDIITAGIFLKEDIANCGEIIDIAPITLEKASRFYNTTGYRTWPLIG